MAIKELQTRIALKYDSYENWKDSELVLLPGEIGICAIGNTAEKGNGEATTNPTVLFKVGDGVTPFKTLKWASALAADVHGWAKASDVRLTGKTIEFVGGVDTEGKDIIVKSIPINYATPEEVAAAVKVVADDVNGLTTRMAAVEAALGVDSGSEDSVSARLEAAEEAIEAINDEESGILASAKAYTDAREVEINKYADQAETDAIAAAKEYTDAEVKKNTDAIDALETADAAQDTLISNNADAIKELQETTIPGVISDYKAADLAINNKIGDADTAAEGTVYGAIADAKKAGTDAADAVSDLAEGQVATNTTNIAGLETRIGNEETARANADAALNTRLEKVEAFFEGAAKDEGEGESLKNALDTLKEIQEFATGEGTAAQEMLDAIDENAKAITALQDIVKDGGTLEVRVDDAQTRVAGVETRAKTLEDIVAGYAATNDDPYKTVKAHVDAVSVRAEKGITDAATAQSAAEAAQGDATKALADAKQAQDEVDALELVVDGVKETADKAKTDLAALTGRVTTAEGDIDALEAVVVTGNDSNDKLRTAITSLQELTDDASKGNAKLRSDLDELAGKVNDQTTGLAATKVIADGAASQAETNKTDIANIKENYLKAADILILYCGSSTELIDEVPTKD